MRGKGVVSIFIFLAFSLQSQAFEAEINSNQNKIYLDDSFVLTIDIKTEDGQGLEIQEMKGIENFEVISRSHSQASSTSISVVNGRAETVSKALNSVILTLKPKSEGEFTIGPVKITSGDETKETNTLSLLVTPKKNASTGMQEIQEIIDKQSISEKEKELPSKYITYFLILVLLVILFLAGVIFYKQKLEPGNKFLQKNKKKKYDLDEDVNKEDFEVKKVEIYPTLDDAEFIVKIENVLKSKIGKKYDIKDMRNKSYTQILDSLDDNLADKKILEDIFDEIQKLKYSNILVSKAKLLDEIKKI